MFIVSDEAWKTIGILAGIVYASRLNSRGEHKKNAEVGKQTSEDVTAIKGMMNGEFEKRLAEEKIKWEKENARQ